MSPEDFTAQVVKNLQSKFKISAVLLDKFVEMFSRYLNSMPGRRIFKGVEIGGISLSCEVGSPNQFLEDYHGKVSVKETPIALQSTCDALFKGQVNLMVDVSTLKNKMNNLVKKTDNIVKKLADKDRRILFTSLTTIVVWIGMEMFIDGFDTKHFQEVESSDLYKNACKKLRQISLKLEADCDLQLDTSGVIEHLVNRKINMNYKCNPTDADVEDFLNESLLVLSGTDERMKNQLIEIATKFEITDFSDASKRKFEFFFEKNAQQIGPHRKRLKIR
eukprot:NODE_179_length_13932_cov_0.652064.p5 type:complete len:276 gc:universal NODE_179_length_13932_cov_0.652064:4727-3900(-)